MRRRIATLLLALSPVFAAIPAIADDSNDSGDTLASITDDLRRSLSIEARTTRWLPGSDRGALLNARLNNVAETLRAALADAGRVLLPWVGHADDREVATLILRSLMEVDPDDRAFLRTLLSDWILFQDQVTRARDLRLALGHQIGLELDYFGRTCPVSGSNRYEHDWGVERPWGRFHRGIDLMADAGTPLVAIERGIITQADWHWAGGFGIYLHGSATGQDYYYAHLAGYAPNIDPGDIVEAGELLGWVGSTGNATSPHLHLGWMPHGGGLDFLEDPYPLVDSLCSP